MKLIKYFFTIPFNPKEEWKKANIEINKSSKLNEKAIVLLLLMTGLSIGYSYYYDNYSGDGFFSLESALIKYFRLLIVTVFTALGIRMFGAAYDLKNIEFVKSFIIVVLGGGLINVLSNFVFFYLEEYLMYSLFGPSFLNFIFLTISAFYITKGIIPNYGINFKMENVTKNTAAIILIVLLLFCFNFLYMGVIAYI